MTVAAGRPDFGAAGPVEELGRVEPFLPRLDIVHGAVSVRRAPRRRVLVRQKRSVVGPVRLRIERSGVGVRGSHEPDRQHPISAPDALRPVEAKADLVRPILDILGRQREADRTERPADALCVDPLRPRAADGLVGDVDPGAAVDSDRRGPLHVESLVLSLLVPPAVVEGLVGPYVETIDGGGVGHLKGNRFHVARRPVGRVHPNRKRDRLRGRSVDGKNDAADHEQPRE